MTPEGRVKDRVKKALTSVNAYRFMPVQNGMGSPSLDFINCVNGLFVAIETKVPGKRLSLRQRATAEAMAKAGALVFVIRDDADIVHMLQSINSGRSTRGVIYDTMEQPE